ncbi:hypothetical protein OHD16_21440 [Sphingobacterium sp. ML3W]|uniref:hypothetical protein n=1 Tax=Sphingobacterium sp. ML3W TaxID=1538644 RepID=UPI00249AC08D|nr:hypothetical protein [Sphingobacterium sp. ML3W]WFA77296.1 hypothetical protein OGI71_14580 [Sphingobacterium sp. ML3W]
MCEITTKWGPSEWSGIIQAVGAIIASIFLFLTFRSQKRSEKLMKESAEIDKRAKRGEYLPEIKLEILTFYPTISDGFGGAKIRKYNGEITTIEIKVIFNKNSVQILDFEFL